MLTQSDLRKIKDLFERTVTLKKKASDGSFATKKDLIPIKKELKTIKNTLKNVVTKDEAQNFITKDDAKAFATKDDLKAFATKTDLRDVKEDLHHGIQEIIEFIGDIVTELKENNAQLQELLTKHDHTIDNHETRIKKLEIKNPLAI